MDEHILQFLRNSASARKEIASNESLVTKMKEVLSEWNSENSESSYFPLLPRQYALKRKLYYTGMSELAITAHTYRTDIPASSFAVVVTEKSPNHITYVVEDFGEIKELFGTDILERNEMLSGEFDRLRKHLESLGYNLLNPEMMCGIVKEDSKERMVVHDLDIKTFENRRELRRGLIGQGDFSELKRIYDILISPKYSLAK